MEDSPQPGRQAPAPWPATLLAVLGGALAVGSIRLEHYGADFGACACLLLSWWMVGSPGEDGLLDHPLARRSTRIVLLAFAVLTGVIGTLRLIRGG